MCCDGIASAGAGTAELGHGPPRGAAAEAAHADATAEWPTCRTCRGVLSGAVTVLLQELSKERPMLALKHGLQVRIEPGGGMRPLYSHGQEHEPEVRHAHHVGAEEVREALERHSAAVAHLADVLIELLERGVGDEPLVPQELHHVADPSAPGHGATLVEIDFTENVHKLYVDLQAQQPGGGPFGEAATRRTLEFRLSLVGRRAGMGLDLGMQALLQRDFCTAPRNTGSDAEQALNRGHLGGIEHSIGQGNEQPQAVHDPAVGQVLVEHLAACLPPSPQAHNHDAGTGREIVAGGQVEELRPVDAPLVHQHLHEDILLG
mmetsp:Transcript_73843/g.186098  ORF Transcript_73843/g.186098 Transcript_73843/m.186098 type:complete len:319 (+) Transcript_73843:63-1019(+)